jgi:TolB-like protein
MTRPERWQQVEALFHAAMEQPVSQREEFLRQAAGVDSALAEEVRLLLQAGAGAGESFMEALDLNRAAGLLEDPLTGPRPGDRVGPYIVEREIGRGGMGTVYLARDPRLERAVALKILSPAYSEEQARRRLLAEARAASAIDHPNIATVHDVGETADGRPWVAMTRYLGRTLRECITDAPLAIATALDLARQIAAGLGSAHAHGIVHCDVKPANVVITPDGRARILDFGIARGIGSALTSSPLLGTVAYMSPEQTRGEAVDGGTDVWAVGVVLYEMLTGRRPFTGHSDTTVIHSIRSDAPPPLTSLRPDVPRSIAGIVERCLEKRPERRFTMSELEAALTAVHVTSSSAFSGRRVAGVLTALLIVGTISAWAVRANRISRSPVMPEASRILVVPFAAIPGDSALTRLGQELAITVARTLDGIDGLSIVDPLPLLAQADRDVSSFASDAGATTLLGGSIVHAGDSVRVDVTLRTQDSNEVIAQAGVTGARQNIAVLTDEIALAVLRQIWRRGPAPVPSLAAITTRSVDALRAFLDGERAIAESRFYQAPADFERAISADSSFWFAYWRLWYARSWHGQRVDSTISSTVLAHLEELPEQDRPLVRSRMAASQRERKELLEQAVAAFPTYWPAWFDYADWLVHNGPYNGVPLDEARRALEHTVALNPDLVAAWTHLFWVAVYERDTALSDRIMAEFERLRVDSLRAGELRFDVLQYYGVLGGLVRSAGRPDPVRAESAARAIAGLRAPLAHESLSTGLHLYGFHTAQLDLLDRIAALRPAPDIAVAHQYGRAWSWAGRGAWDSALVAATRYAEGKRAGHVELLPAQIAVLGALFGALDPSTAAERLRAARTLASGAPAPIRSELAWLDGVAAHLRDDAEGIKAARVELARIDDDVAAATLGRSLAGLATEAADSLAELEWEGARAARQFGLGREHPYFSAVNRMLAAQWLLAAGDTATADALLLFHQAVFPEPLRRMKDGNQALAPLADAMRARIATAQGRFDAAARLYAHVLERMDAPAPALAAIVAEARAGLERDGRRGR